MSSPSQAVARDDDNAGPSAGGAWPTEFYAWTGQADFESGDLDASVTIGSNGGLTLADGAGEGGWISPWHAPAEPFTSLVPSWQSATPPGTWVEIEVQVRTAAAESRWFAMGAWAFDTSMIERRSTKGQVDPVGRVDTDTFMAAADAPGGMPVAYRMRVTLHGGAASPAIRQVGASTARPGPIPEATSEPSLSERVELNVPAYSQSVHRKEYPEFGGGGAVWCSPASTSMLLSYWGTGPTPDELATLPPDPVFDLNGRADAQVAWAAIHTWDYVYCGAGNWPFNAAYAAEYGLDGSIRHYCSLRDVEAWVARGVPVLVSTAWDNKAEDPRRHLDGSSIEQTRGHIMVVVGFTQDGDVIANDPASPSNDQVRHVYRRDQFERNWLSSSKGTTYLIKLPSIVG
ncbi:MAG TPA: peptidase C39 family protein [Jiangellaceae bacterium]